MKAIKDCKWKVTVWSPVWTGKYGWLVYLPSCGTGIRVTSQKDDYCSSRCAKEDWEEFAKINGIVNWEYTKELR